MPENYTPAASATGTWTEEEIRHQPRAWIRSLTNIDALRSALNNFLEPLLRKENLRIILTGAGTSAFIGDIIAPWLASHTGKNFSAVPTTDLVTNPMDYLNPAHPLLLISFGRSGNSPESVAAVELANQFVPECYHLPITCNEAGALYQNAINSDNAFALRTGSPFNNEAERGKYPEDCHTKRHQTFLATKRFSVSLRRGSGETALHFVS